jgi:hypothetical protein
MSPTWVETAGLMLAGAVAGLVLLAACFGPVLCY